MIYRPPSRLIKVKMPIPAVYLNRIQNLLHQQTLQTDTHILFTNREFEIPGEPILKYIPSKTGCEFHDDDSMVRLVMGPYGSGKSSMCCAEIVKRACEMPVWSSGRRKSRWMIVRNTYGELKSTSLQTWLSWFRDLGDIRKNEKPVLTYEHTFNDGKGIVELEVIFLALDRSDDLRKVKSLEVTGVYLNELSELPADAISHLVGRIKRYPKIDLAPGGYWSGIIADTNPPDSDSWIYRTFEEIRPEGYKLFHQPPGIIKGSDGKYSMNPNADNIDHLASRYYLDMALGQSEEFIKVFCQGLYGTVSDGRIVYNDYNDDVNSAEGLEPIKESPILLGWDFGTTPACVIAQFQHGRLFILKEFSTEYMGLKSLVENHVIPCLNTEFKDFPIEASYCDPSGIASGQVDLYSCVQLLNDSGIKTCPAKTNAIDPRIESVRYFLNKSVLGRPAFVLDKKKCPVLRKGFLRDYYYKRYRILGDDKYHDKPNKNISSNVHDALQYICVEYAHDRGSKMYKKSVQDFDNPTFRFNL